MCLWMLEALKQNYDLTLFSLTGVQLKKLNTMYGTTLTQDSIEMSALWPQWFERMINFLVANNRDLRKIFIHLLLRFLKQKGGNYDLLISAYNAADLGQPGLQYIHWVKVLEGGKQQYNRISQFSLERLKQNVSIVNSKAVAEATQSTYGLAAKVIYPPVVIDNLSIPWDQKENAFICSGRLIEAKSPHSVIRILEQVRAKGFDIKLYLTGGGGGIYAWRYRRFLNHLIKANASWITLFENLSYTAYTQLLSQCKYGIHYKQEPFGISIAEMLKSGAIPFVRSTGGQVEIVGQQDDILFENETEAVSKIIKILADSSRQEQIISSLTQRKSLFSTEKFMAEITAVVDGYFNPTVANLE